MVFTNIALHHYLLTRFNLLLWTKDKAGHKVRTAEWLEHRFALFERYCLPSIKAQTCQEFEWIVLFDSSTQKRFKSRIAEWQKVCPQLRPVFVEPEKGRYFAEIFRDEVCLRLSLRQAQGPQGRVLTTYLDNDDALSVRFVEDVQLRALALADGTFIYYTDGYQFFTDHGYMMRIRYPRNHFASVVEDGNPATLKTIYGYGSHYYVDKIPGVKLEMVKDLPLWCEVIHEKNMGNDAYFLGARMVKKAEGFGFMAEGSRFNAGLGVYLFRFLPRYVRTFVRRVIIKLRGYRFE